MRRLASIDIGTQTIRLLVADVTDDGILLPLLRDQAIMRLGEGMGVDGLLQRHAITRASACIAGFTERARNLKVETIFAVATACVRNGVNREDFLRAVQEQAGILPAVLTGHEEALTTLAGVQSVIPRLPGDLLVIDIGGGSTEFVLLEDAAGSSRLRAESMPLGVIGLAERHLQDDPPQPTAIRALRSETDDMLYRYAAMLLDKKIPNHVIGTAGTATTLAAMDLGMTRYDPVRINGHELHLMRIEKFLHDMTAMKAAERVRIPGLEAGRVTVIIPGACILITLLRSIRRSFLTVSDAGLLEGIIIRQVQRQ